MAEGRDVLSFDVVIVGAGPAGLSAAIRVKQLNPDVSVCVLEKGAEVGAHILSGAVLETRALDSLIPEWREKSAPVTRSVEREEFLFLTKKSSWQLPTPPQMKNHGNFIISLGVFCRWLGEQASSLGVEIFPGFAASSLIIEEGKLCGVLTGDMGIGKDGEKTSSYQPGVEIRGKFTAMAEGCRGSLSEQLLKEFSLRDEASPQTYAIGIKELWEVKSDLYQPGKVTHSVGWPLSSDVYGGSFIYHLDGGKVAVGFVVGLDYANPYLDPYQEFQRFKNHPKIRPLFEGGRRLVYGARALNEGGYQSIPKLVFEGGVLIGCSAGFMNVPKIKGTHTAMQSAIYAAEAIVESLNRGSSRADSYVDKIKNSWVYEELYQSRNIRPAFKYGFMAGMLNAAVDTYILRGNAPWTFGYKADNEEIRPAAEFSPILYPKPDGVVSFDRMSSVYLSNTNHDENQPSHLKLRDSKVPLAVNFTKYAGLEARFCPAGVYEYVEDGENGKKLQINSQNCVHCKTCDIKDPTQNITWTVPQGGEGPCYGEM